MKTYALLFAMAPLAALASEDNCPVLKTGVYATCTQSVQIFDEGTEAEDVDFGEVEQVKVGSLGGYNYVITGDHEDEDDDPMTKLLTHFYPNTPRRTLPIGDAGILEIKITDSCTDNKLTKKIVTVLQEDQPQEFPEISYEMQVSTNSEKTAVKGVIFVPNAEEPVIIRTVECTR